MKNKGSGQILGILLLVVLGFFIFKDFFIPASLTISAPVITVGEDGIITVAESQSLQSGGYEKYEASIWVDGKYLCCQGLSGSFSCTADNPSQGWHNINVYMVAWSGSRFRGSLCNQVDYPDRNLVTSEGIGVLKYYAGQSGSGYGFDEKSIRWYVAPIETTTTSTISGVTTTTIQPPQPDDPVREFIFNKILPFFTNILSSIKSFFHLASITSEDIYINNPYSKSITMSTTESPDTDYTDGTRSWFFGVYRIYDPNDNILKEDSKEIQLGQVDFLISFTPTQAGKYKIIGMIVKIEKVWSNGEWIEQEAVKLDEYSSVINVKDIIQPPTPENPFQFIEELFNSIIDFIRNLFKL